MTYQPAVPQPLDYLSQSQQDFLANYGLLNTYFGIDHVALNAGADQGEHNQATFNNIQADPALGALLFPKCRVYSKHTGAGPNRRTEVYYSTENEPGAVQSIMQLSSVKAWCRFNGTAATPIAIAEGENVTNVTRTAVGVYVVNFTNALRTNTYSVYITCFGQSGVAFHLGGVTATNVNNCLINTRHIAAGAMVNVSPTIVSVLVIGE